MAKMIGYIFGTIPEVITGGTGTVTKNLKAKVTTTGISGVAEITFYDEKGILVKAASVVTSGTAIDIAGDGSLGTFAVEWSGDLFAGDTWDWKVLSTGAISKPSTAISNYPGVQKQFSVSDGGGLKTDVLAPVVSLDAVTAATDGAAVDTSNYKDKTVFVEVSVNTGAVTVNIEASPTGAFAGEEDTLDQKVYTATTATDTFSYTDHFPFMRVTTTSQTNATVSVILTGR